MNTLYLKEIKSKVTYAEFGEINQRGDIEIMRLVNLKAKGKKRWDRGWRPIVVEPVPLPKVLNFI